MREVKLTTDEAFIQRATARLVQQEREREAEENRIREAGNQAAEFQRAANRRALEAAAVEKLRGLVDEYKLISELEDRLENDLQVIFETIGKIYIVEREAFGLLNPQNYEFHWREKVSDLRFTAGLPRERSETAVRDPGARTVFRGIRAGIIGRGRIVAGGKVIPLE